MNIRAQPLLDLRDPVNQESLAQARDIRAGLGKDTCRVLDLVASEPNRLWSAGHVGQECKMIKPTAALTLATLRNSKLVEKVRDRWRITDLGLVIAMPR